MVVPTSAIASLMVTTAEACLYMSNQDDMPTIVRAGTVEDGRGRRDSNQRRRAERTALALDHGNEVGGKLAHP